MTDPSSIDRDAILARRALLLSSALGAVSCSSSSTQDSTTVDVAPPQKPTATAEVPTPAPDKAPTSTLELTEWSEVARLAPPLTVDAGVPAEDKKPLTEQATRMREVYRAMESVWRHRATSCAPGPSGCTSDWTKLREELTEVRLMVHQLRPLCGYGRTTRTAVAQRTAAHERYLAERLSELTGAIDNAYEGWSPAQQQAYDGIGAKVMAVPCLSCMAPPMPDVVGVAIRFDKGTTDVLETSALSLQSMVKQLTAVPTARVLIRGHATPDEPDGQALSEQRAKALKDALIRDGVGASQLDTIGLGSVLPVDNDGSEEGAAGNRRVDFELL